MFSQRRVICGLGTTQSLSFRVMLCPDLALLRVSQYCQRKPLHLCLFSELKVPQLVARQQGDHVKIEDDGVAQGDEVQGVALEGTMRLLERMRALAALLGAVAAATVEEPRAEPQTSGRVAR